MPNEDLPSINDIVEESNLPSYKDFIEVKEEEDLPSVEEYIEKKVVETLEEDIETVLSETTPEWSELVELVRLINDVRKDIPEIPEIKYYDEQLKELSDKLSQIQDLNEDKLTEIESKIPELPDVKYYDADIQFIYDKIDRIKEEINSLPEVKYYESDLNSLKLRIEEINRNIPTLPDWFREVREVPDFSWIGKNFSVIDADFNRVQGHLDTIRGKIDYKVNELNDIITTKEFELKIDVKDLTKNLDQTVVNLEETKDKLLNKIGDVSTRIWEQHNEFKDDDRKLKKSIISEQNKLKQSLQEQIKEIGNQSVKSDEDLLNFFNDLSEEVKSLPETKYYDTEISDIVEDIDSLRVNIEDIKDIVSLIKKDQKQLEENYLLNEPSDKEQNVGSNVDPLTPMDQKFATLDDLSNHYRIFINRIQTQLSTIGGGGETRLQYLDDIAGISTNIGAYDGMVLQVDVNGPEGKKFKFAPSSGGSVGAGGTWSSDAIGVSTTKNVGIATTARTDFALYVGGDQYVDGNITIGGTITYEDVKNVDSIGIVTARSGINVLAGGINAVGIITATQFVGDGSGLTGVVAEGTGIVIQEEGSSVGTAGTINFIGAGVTATLSNGIASVEITATGGGGGISNVVEDTTPQLGGNLDINNKYITGTGGANITGVVTATTFSGSGANLTSVPNGALDNSSVSYGGVELSLGGSDATPAFNLSDATAYPYTSLTGITTEIVGDTTPQLGGNLDLNSKFITGTGGVNVTGVVTATSFVGNVTGNADTATSLATARTFELTGDVVASQISFDGTGNVSLAATIQPNSVALGGDTTGDYVESISGTGNQITVSSGTGEGSTPVISIPNNPTLPGTTVTVATDLQVNRNLNVTGNITIGGTSATLFTETLKISDPDIIVGFRTDAGGNDISNDTTASHGGIAVASTEGSPIVSFVGGGGTVPVTYKKIFWFESGAFTGLATDAWLTNYAFGVGTTSMSAGTKFAVGNIETDFDDITSVRHINSSGVVTATTFSGSGASLTSIPNGALTNSSIAIGGVTLNLGDTDATPAFNLSDATNYPTSSLTGTITNDQLAGSIADGKLASTFLKNVVEDTTPQLGGNLDLNSKFITGTGGINVSGVVTATSFTGSGANLTNLTGASAATYGDASNVAQIVVDANGRITGISEVAISGGGGSGPDPVIMGMIF